MTLNSLSYEKKNLIKYFLGSIVLHVFFVLFFMKFNTVFYKIFNTAPEKTLIKEFVQVDLVGMPKLTKSELEKISPVINHKLPAVEKIDQVNDADSKKSVDGLSEFFKQMSKKKVNKYVDPISGSNKGAIKPRKNKSPSLQKLSRLALEGNQLSRGGVVVGENQGFSNDDYEIYLSSIPAQVRPFWKLPSYLKGEHLKARLKIRIDGNGRIISLDLIESSGVEEFDQRAINAVKDVKLFTVPASSIREELAIRGVVLGFPL